MGDFDNNTDANADASTRVFEDNNDNRIGNDDQDDEVLRRWWRGVGNDLWGWLSTRYGIQDDGDGGSDENDDDEQQ